MLLFRTTKRSIINVIAKATTLKSVAKLHKKSKKHNFFPENMEKL